MISVLSVYIGNMGVSFYENKVINNDEDRYGTEEDFGISHNRMMDISSFVDIMIKNIEGERFVDGYYVIKDKNVIEQLVKEFKL